MPRPRSPREGLNIWPGFVDALSNILIIVIIVTMVFMAAQFFLSDALMGRDKAIVGLQERISALARALALEERKSAEAEQSLARIAEELRATITARRAAEADRDRLARERAGLESERDRLARERAELEERLRGAETDRERLERERAELEKERDGLQARFRATEEELEQTRGVRDEAQAALILLNRQLAELRQQLAAISEALEVAEKEAKDKDLTIDRLEQRLNAALVSKVQELQRYRSEFFGRIREILGDRDDIKIVGDRFVFQSEVLFPSGSDVLQEGGEEQLASVAGALKEIMAKIPDDIDWVLRVDGHTDIRPIRTDRFRSNWELSSARAIAVVRFFIDEGIPANRLVAAGFGEFQPLDDARTQDAFARNRRIELKITER